MNALGQVWVPGSGGAVNQCDPAHFFGLPVMDKLSRENIRTDAHDAMIGTLPGIHQNLRGNTVKLSAAAAKVQIFCNGPAAVPPG